MLILAALILVPTTTLSLTSPVAFAQGDQDQGPDVGTDAGATATPAPEDQASVTPSPSASPTEASPTAAAPTGSPSASAAPSSGGHEPSAPAAGDSASRPTIASDLPDYAPGGTVTLAGAGWQPGEVVTIVVNDTGGLSWKLTERVVADAEGRITLTFDLPPHFVPDYDVTATGLSGVATTTFTDASRPYYFWMTESVPVSTAPVTGGTPITYNLYGQRYSLNTGTVTDASIALTLTGSATFNSSGQPMGVTYIDSKTVRWNPASLGGTSTTVGIKATVTTGAAAGLIVATASGDANGTFYTGSTARLLSITHSVTGKCSFATGSGDFSKSICWFDLAGYNPALAATTAGQTMQQNLLNGYVLSYTIKATGTSTNVVAYAPPTYSAAFLGNTAAGYSNNYQGIGGKPTLYQQQTGGTTTLSLSNISLKDSTGTVVTGFALVGADAESTDSGESITWTSDKVFTSIGPLGNSCGGTLVMSSGDKQAVCNAGPVANKTGAAILYTLDPTTFAQTMVGSGLQAVAFGVMVSGLQLNKQIVNKLPGDQFRVSVKRSDNTEAGFALTDLTTGFAATDQIYTISSGSSQTFTLSETPVGSTNPLNYATSWACTKNGVAFTPTNVSGSIKTAAVTMSDFVTCTITNTGPSVTLRKTTTGVAGGPFGFTVSNASQASGSVTTTAADMAAQVDGDTATAGTQPFTLSGIGTAVKITEASVAGWQLDSATCVNAAGTTVGSLSAGAYTIPAASVVAGSAFTCDFTNSRIPPKVTLRKTTTGVAGGPFAFTLTNTTQLAGSVTTSAPGTPAQVGTFTASSFGTQVTIAEGASASWVLTSATCRNAANAVVGTLSGSTYTIPAPEIIAGAVITCDYINRPYLGTVTWSKVDAGSITTLLKGSEWTLTGPSYPTPGTTVSDCVAASAAACAGVDKDPVAGSFSVSSLANGAYTLVEKTAPFGFQLDTAPHPFSISTDGSTLALGSIINRRVPVPAVPLTGGSSTDSYLISGIALLLLAGLAAWYQRRRRISHPRA